MASIKATSSFSLPAADCPHLKIDKMRLALALAFLPPIACAAVPEMDVRQNDVASYKTHFTMPPYATRAEWEIRKQQLRKQILSAAGLLPMPARPAIHAEFVRKTVYKEYSIEAVLVETIPGYFLGGNLYRPTHLHGRAPGILLPHGHWKHGRLENQPSYSVPALGINLALQGYVAFAYDMVGYNDTRQTPHAFGGWEEALWSFSPMGLQLWNSMRALDFLEGLPDVDPRRLAITGASGGASQTFLLAAVDDRVGYAAPVNMISAYMQGGDPCEEAPNLRIETSNVEIAAMMAPRPMLIVSSTRDWTRHTPLEELPEIRRIYELYGVPELVQNAHIDAEHNYNRQSRDSVYRFLARYLKPDLSPATLADRDVEVPADEDLLALAKGDLPQGMAGLSAVFETWKEAGSVDGDPRETLRYALEAQWPEAVESSADGSHIVLSRPGKSDRVSGWWIPGEGAPVLLLHPAGSPAAMQTEIGAQLARSGRPILIIEPFTSGPLRTHRQRSDAYFLSYNRGDAADRVQDILTALAFLKSRSSAIPTLVGLKDAAIWAVFAAAIAPVEIEVMADISGFSGSDEELHERFFVPGIQRAGGWSAALHLVNPVMLTPAISESQ
jgi:dienelactone hydrolase